MPWMAKKRAWLVLLTALAAACCLAPTALAAALTAGDTVWTDGEYVSSENLTIDSRVVVHGNVTLTLAGGTLHIPKGISVGEDYSLTINGSSGSLLIDDVDMGLAGIGGESVALSGGEGAPCGTVTINGGTINVHGGNGGAGIGAGNGSSIATIYIHGGSVTAYGGGDDATGAAAIGGGADIWESGTRGSVTITGGTVRAYASTWGAGIGAGGCADITPSTRWTITISGGDIIAQGGSNTDGGAGIGGGFAVGASITISGSPHDYSHRRTGRDGHRQRRKQP